MTREIKVMECTYFRDGIGCEKCLGHWQVAKLDEVTCAWRFNQIQCSVGDWDVSKGNQKIESRPISKEAIAHEMKFIKIIECTEKAFSDCGSCPHAYTWFVVTAEGEHYIEFERPNGDKCYAARKPNKYTYVKKYELLGEETYIVDSTPDREEVSEVKLYHTIAWHKDKDGERDALAYRNWVQAESIVNAQVKAMLDKDNWIGGTHSDPDAFIWQVLEAK